ncbi:hypothetical protein PMZ80_005606 [Knufia obscura]|uniref:Cytochrome P450 n=2 Tax=Knufia TaxID=430999 RepID=A0AAN8E8Z9_9EURO|nr:hypothetical protein PMZ80_005606 [Knufia obscura]KAK5949364.1 hypothetical protein OHC33_009536 [Knufia fluminis]
MLGVLALTFRFLLAGIALIVLKKLVDHVRSPLRQFDGPFLAKFTDLWRLLDIKTTRRCDITHNNLHKQYGPAVRMGPNCISLADPGLIKVVYTGRPRWKKSTMCTYPSLSPNKPPLTAPDNVNDALGPDGKTRITNLNSETNESAHDKTVAPIRSMYTMSNVKSFEPLIDPVITRLCAALESRFIDGANAGTSFDAADWMNYAAWDIMSEITFGKPFGFIDQGKDVGGFLATSQRGLDYFAVICQMPWLDLVLDKNPVKRIGAPSFSWAVEFSVGALVERYQQMAADGEKKVEEKPVKDFLDKFLEAKAKAEPGTIDDMQVVNFLLVNVLAGSDTTAITLGAAVYYLLKNPAVLKKLVRELDERELSTPVSWTETLELPYLNAVMQETMRIHGGVGLMLEREVPAGGFSLPDGRFVPGGTVVGMNPWVVHMNEEYFGPNTEKFVPERWMRRSEETTEQFEAREKKMKEATLTFGHGSRICLGRNLSRLEANKVIATLSKNYEWSLVQPEKDWKIRNSWFTYQSGINVTVKKRGQKAECDVAC